MQYNANRFMARSMLNTQEKNGTFELKSGMSLKKCDFLPESGNVDTYVIKGKTDNRIANVYFVVGLCRCWLELPTLKDVYGLLMSDLSICA